MLLYDNATFMQVLEGAEEDVHDIYNSILRDSRNNANVILVEEEIEQRDFPRWSMGFKNLKSCSPEELVGFQDIFNNGLDKELAVKDTTKALGLWVLQKMSNKTLVRTQTTLRSIYAAQLQRYTEKGVYI